MLRIMVERYAGWFLLCSALGALLACAPIEYTVDIAEASGLLAQAEEAGAACTDEELVKLTQAKTGIKPEETAAQPDEVDSETPIRPKAESEPVKASQGTGPEAHIKGGCNAPFEYYFSKEYLNKAREEVGYSDYQAALEYLQVAKDYAKQAYEIATRRQKERGR